MPESHFLVGLLEVEPSSEDLSVAEALDRMLSRRSPSLVSHDRSAGWSRGLGSAVSGGTTVVHADLTRLSADLIREYDGAMRPRRCNRIPT